MFRRLKLPRLLLVWSLVGLMLVNGAVRAACLCTDGQSKVFCGKLFERMVLGQPTTHQAETVDCCCENCAARQADASDSSELATNAVENRQCQPTYSVMDCQLPEIRNFSGLLHALTLAVDQPNLNVESTPSSQLELLCDSDRGSSLRAQQIFVLLI